jgi:aryl-alcohol dehydrogenase-like predicted oxidoreductase
MTRERVEALPEGDFRRHSDRFRDPELGRNLAIVEVLRGIARGHGCTVPEAAIAWTLHNPAVTGAIVGVRNQDQVEGVIRASRVELTEEDLETLRSVHQEEG